MNPLTNDCFIRELIFLKEEFPDCQSYPFRLPFLQTDSLLFHPKVTYIIGENGMGKSTLLEAIAIASGFNPEGGTSNFNFSTYDSHSPLEKYVRLVKGIKKPQDGFFLRAESFYNVATQIEEIDREGAAGKVIDSFGGTSLHQQSHGEAFFAAFNYRFRGSGLYILDEPEAALSPLRQLSLLARIHDLAEARSQFIIATHSPLLMAYPKAQILEITGKGIQERQLEETGHYKIMKQFFDDKDRLLHHLLNADD